MRQGKYLGKCEVQEIHWEEKELKELIKQRMIHYSINKSSPNQALVPLFDPKGKTVPIDDEIVRFANDNPRAVIWLANRLFMEHCQSEPVPFKIDSRTWDRVQLDWLTTGRNQILGAAGKANTFFAIGNDIYFNNKPLNLSTRSKALLKSLVDADGQTSSKEELIRAGWPGVRSEGVTEAALREAMRRLKIELRGKNEMNPAWIETQHDQGYRLWEPDSGLEKEES
jgi:DNA-binding winged helix-turn-helix (wHTH) protein